MVLGEDEVRTLALLAFGRMSVSITQPGRGTPIVGTRVHPECEDGDYLVARNGERLGYGELANRFAAALDAELAEFREAMR